MSINKYSQVFTLTQYIPPVDLGLMATVLQQKQQKYDANKQLLNKTASSLLSQDVARDSDREYLNQKSELAFNRINSMGSMDLSNSNITSELQGMIMNVGKDKRIVNSIAQTKKLRALQLSIESTKKSILEGKKDILYNEYTEYFDNKRMSNYLNSTDELSLLEGSSNATLWHDWQKEADEQVKKIHLKFYSNFSLVAGSSDLYLNKTDGKYVTKEQIYSTISDSLSESAKNAMKLESDYKYRNTLNEALLEIVNNHYAEQYDEVKNRIRDIDSRIAFTTGKDNENLRKQKEELEKVVIPRIDEQRNKVIKAAYSNLDQVKFGLFYDSSLKAIANLNAYDEKKTDYQLNEAKVKMTEWAIDERKQNNIEANDALERQLKQVQILKTKVEASKIAAELGEGTGLNFSVDGNGNIILSESHGLMYPTIMLDHKNKVSYGDNLDDEANTVKTEMISLLTRLAKERLSLVDLTVIKLSTNTLTGLEIDLSRLKKLEKTNLQVYNQINGILKVRDQVAHGEILENLFSLSEISSFNEFNALKAEYLSIVSQNNQIRAKAMQDYFSAKKLPISQESYSGIIKVFNAYKEFEKRQSGGTSSMDATGGIYMSEGSSLSENLDKFFAANPKWKGLRRAVALMNEDEYENYFKKVSKDYLKPKEHYQLSTVKMFDKQDLGLKSRVEISKALEVLARQNSIGLEFNDGSTKTLKNDEFLEPIGVSAGYAIVNVRQGIKSDDGNLSKGEYIGQAKIRIQDSEKGILGSAARFMVLELYLRYEKALELNGKIEYQVLDDKLLIKLIITKVNLEQHNGLVNISIETGKGVIVLYKSNILNARVALSTMENLIKESKAQGITDINTFFKAANLR